MTAGDPKQAQTNPYRLIYLQMIISLPDLTSVGKSLLLKPKWHQLSMVHYFFFYFYIVPLLAKIVNYNYRMLATISGAFNLIPGPIVDVIVAPRK